MQIEDGFLRHLTSYRIDGFPLDDTHHLTRARSTLRITVPNAAYGFGVRSSAIAVERPLLPALAEPRGYFRHGFCLFRRFKTEIKMLTAVPAAVPSSLIGRAISQ